MSAFPPSDDQQPQTLRTLASKAQLADYLEAQADQLERERPDDRYAPALAELALSFAELAEAHELDFVSERFRRLLGRKANGTDGR